MYALLGGFFHFIRMECNGPVCVPKYEFPESIKAIPTLFAGSRCIVSLPASGMRNLHRF